MIKQGESLFYMGRLLKREVFGSGAEEVVENLNGFEFYLSLQSREGEKLRLKALKFDGYFTFEIENTQSLKGNYIVEVGVTIDGKVLVCNRNKSLYVKDSILASSLSGSNSSLMSLENSSNSQIESENSDGISKSLYRIELVESGSAINLNSWSDNSSMDAYLGLVIKGEKGESGEAQLTIEMDGVDYESSDGKITLPSTVCDETPTENSSRAVTSGGVYSANKDIEENISVITDTLLPLKADKSDVYTKDEINQDFVASDGYIAFQESEKTKLSGIEEGAQVNPTSLPNPKELIINGTSYDGSEKVDIVIVSDSSGVEFPILEGTTTESIQTIVDNGVISADLVDRSIPISKLNVATQTLINSVTSKANLFDIPEELPNPYSLTINGNSYDGSTAVNINIEAGEGGSTNSIVSVQDIIDAMRTMGPSGSGDASDIPSNEYFWTKYNEAYDNNTLIGLYDTTKIPIYFVKGTVLSEDGAIHYIEVHLAFVNSLYSDNDRRSLRVEDYMVRFWDDFDMEVDWGDWGVISLQHGGSNERFLSESGQYEYVTQVRHVNGIINEWDENLGTVINTYITLPNTVAQLSDTEDVDTIINAFGGFEEGVRPFVNGLKNNGKDIRVDYDGQKVTTNFKYSWKEWEDGQYVGRFNAVIEFVVDGKLHTITLETGKLFKATNEPEPETFVLTHTIVDVDNKVDKEDGKALSANDFTDELRTRLENTLSESEVEALIPSIEGLATESYVSTAIGNIEFPTTDLSNYVQITDSRLSDSRPASDVSSWAKADEKPTYIASEVGALPDTTVIPSTEGLATENYVDTNLATKQPLLTAGDNITIADNVISASGGGSNQKVLVEQVGTITNAGEGWNSFEFPIPFEDDIKVFVSPSSVHIKNVTKTGFMYNVYDTIYSVGTFSSTKITMVPEGSDTDTINWLAAIISEE